MEIRASRSMPLPCFRWSSPCPEPPYNEIDDADYDKDEDEVAEPESSPTTAVPAARVTVAAEEHASEHTSHEAAAETGKKTPPRGRLGHGLLYRRPLRHDLLTGLTGRRSLVGAAGAISAAPR
jgi:hypothetical protein